MDPDTLRSHLSTLHDELRDAPKLDARSSALLVEVLKDIERTLEAGSARPSGVALADRLENAAVQFEADHPGLAASSRRLIDLLGKVGL